MSTEHTHRYAAFTGKCETRQELNPQYTEFQESLMQRAVKDSFVTLGYIPSSEEANPASMTHHNTVAIRVSRDYLLGMGNVKPTPEEQAEMDERSRLHTIERNKRAVIREAAWAQLRAACEPVLAVLDLHAMVDATNEWSDPTCAHCWSGDDREDWPCETVRVIGNAYGIEMP